MKQLTSAVAVMMLLISSSRADVIKPVDVKATSHFGLGANIENLIKTGKFRLDLYYRLNVITLELPPLRTIKQDIEPLSYHVLTELNKNHQKTVNKIDPKAMALLQKHSWPGNVRELRNVLERALIICNANHITITDLPTAIGQKSGPVFSEIKQIPLLKSVMQEVEIKTISAALKLTGNNKRQTARHLGINRSGLYHKMKKYGLM